MLKRRCHHRIIYKKPFVYVIGGCDGSIRLSECEKINIEEIISNSRIDI
jgi:hypothetical protein